MWRPVSQQSFPHEHDQLLLIIDEDGHRWVSYSENLGVVVLLWQDTPVANVLGSVVPGCIFDSWISDVDKRPVYDCGHNSTWSHLEREVSTWSVSWL